MKIKNLLLMIVLGALSTSVNAGMVLVDIYEGNDGHFEDGSTKIEGIIGTTADFTDISRVNWLLDANPDTAGNQLLNPQTDGGLTIVGNTFKSVPDNTEVITLDWSWDSSFDNLDYLSFKFDGFFALYEITDSMTSGSWSAQEMCDDFGYCAGKKGTKAFSLSHVVAYSVSEVPVPASLVLFASGLLGIIGFMRRKA